MQGGARRRVAVTGLGAICALGGDVPAIWSALQAGRSGIRPIAGIPTDRLSASIAAEIAGFDGGAHFDSRRLPMLDRSAQLAVVAAREAVGQAGLAPDPTQAARRGAIMAAVIGQSSLDASYLAFYGEGASRVHPFTVPRVMPNAPASHLSIEFGLRGPCYAVASACASGNHAIALAADTIRAGRAEVILAGGADASIVVGVFKCWEALRVLSADTCRPFSRDRTGLVLGEGAAVLVLEDWDHARRRGATILAEVAGSGMSADAADITAPDIGGASAAMQAALDDARLDRPPPMSSSKSMIGHCLSAGGALEAVATVMALRDGVLPPTAGFRETDPECDVDCVPNVSRAVPIQAALSNSFAFGGLNAVLAFRKAA